MANKCNTCLKCLNKYLCEKFQSKLFVTNLGLKCYKVSCSSDCNEKDKCYG